MHPSRGCNPAWSWPRLVLTGRGCFLSGTRARPVSLQNPDGPPRRSVGIRTASANTRRTGRVDRIGSKTERERAALAWTEAVTLIANGHVPDAVYEEVRQHLSEEELVNLTLAVVAINGWNRFAISFRTVPGTYQPAHR